MAIRCPPCYPGWTAGSWTCVGCITTRTPLSRTQRSIWPRGLDVGQYAYAYRRADHTAGRADRPFRLTARVRYHAIEDSWAEAGLMLRAALDPAAAFPALIGARRQGRVLGPGLSRCTPTRGQPPCGSQRILPPSSPRMSGCG